MSLIPSENKHLCICLLAICISSSVNCMFIFLFIFLLVFSYWIIWVPYIQGVLLSANISSTSHLRLIAWNWPWWKYLYHKSLQKLHPNPHPIVKCLPAHHCLSILNPKLLAAMSQWLFSQSFSSFLQHLLIHTETHPPWLPLHPCFPGFFYWKSMLNSTLIALIPKYHYYSCTIFLNT